MKPSSSNKHEFFGSAHLTRSPSEDLDARIVKALAYMATKATYDQQQIQAAIQEDSAGELSRGFAARTFDYLSSQGIDIREARFMDLGAGLGAVSEEAAVRGANPIAVEPGTGYREITSERIRRGGRGMVVAALAESLPFPDNSFDLIISMEVLEHVQFPAAMLREVCRVLRPGGWLYLTCPNYFSFREPHYNLMWLPFLSFMPKPLGTLYLRLRGRPTEFFRTSITYITLPWVRRQLKALGFQSLREQEMSAMCRSPISINSRRKRALIEIARKLLGTGLVIKTVAWLDRSVYLSTHTFTPGIAMLVQKRGARIA